MRVRYRERARRDLGEIHHYLDARSPSGARNVLRAIYAGVQFIAENPDAAERTDDPSVRVKIVLRYRYKFFTVLPVTSLTCSTFGTRRSGCRGKGNDERVGEKSAKNFASYKLS